MQQRRYEIWKRLPVPCTSECKCIGGHRRPALIEDTVLEKILLNGALLDGKHTENRYLTTDPSYASNRGLPTTCRESQTQSCKRFHSFLIQHTGEMSAVASPRLAHNVWFKFKSDATPDQIKHVFDSILGLKAKIPVILHVTAGKNITDRAKGVRETSPHNERLRP